MRSIKLNEEQIQTLENLLGEIPMKWASPIMQVLATSIEQPENDPNPIGGGGGAGSPRPQKGEKE